jgi:endo-1,4-beta-mannosidase
MTVVQLRPLASHRSEPASFRLGVNYWPAAKGPTFWKNFDIDEVHSDMNTIAELGLDVVRVFVNWEDFQPDPEGVKCCALARLTAFCDAVAAEGLKTIITLNMGHWGGHNWVPSWLLDSQAAPSAYPTISGGQRVTSGYRNPFTDPVARKAAVRLVRAISRTLSDHQAVWAYDLGNEVDQFAHGTGAEILKPWYEEMVEAVRGLDQKHNITCGFGVQGLFSNTATAVSELGAVPCFGSVQLDASGFALSRGFLDSDLLPFSCALGTSLTQKPCFASDWSVATESVTPTNATGANAHTWVAGEDAAAGFAEELLPKLLEGGALGALIGNFSDIDPSIYGHPPYDIQELERNRGLVRVDGTLKPHGQVVRRFAESNPQVPAIPTARSSLAVLDRDFSKEEDPLEHSRRLYGIFAAQSAGFVRGRLG